eukprot:gene30277-25789_t
MVLTAHAAWIARARPLHPPRDLFIVPLSLLCAAACNVVYAAAYGEPRKGAEEGGDACSPACAEAAAALANVPTATVAAALLALKMLLDAVGSALLSCTGRRSKLQLIEWRESGEDAPATTSSLSTACTTGAEQCSPPAVRDTRTSDLTQTGDGSG